MSNQAHESHTGPIKTPRQLLWTSFFAFVVPVAIIIGLVFFDHRLAHREAETAKAHRG